MHFCRIWNFAKIRLRSWDIILKYKIKNKDNLKYIQINCQSVAFLRNLENDVNFTMKMTFDRKLLLISFVRLLKFYKNQFLKCCFLEKFKKWHQFLCEDDLWSKIVTNNFVMLVKYCKNQFLKVAFLRNLIFLSAIQTANHHRKSDVIFSNSAKKQHFENWFLQYLTSLTNLLVTIFDQRSSSQRNLCHFLNSAKKQHFKNWFLQNFKSLIKLISNNFRSKVIFIEKLMSFSKFRKKATFWQLICMYFFIISIFRPRKRASTKAVVFSCSSSCSLEPFTLLKR